MTTHFLELVKDQRHTLSAALLVGLFLLLMGHLPVLPVLAGCALAIGVSLLRAWLRRWRSAPLTAKQRA